MKEVLRLTKQDGTVVAQPLEVASNFFARGVGLMGRGGLPENGGLLILGCNGIHMMFMRFPIDAVFVDKKGVVVKTYERLLPWIGMVPFVWRADKVAELPAGTIRRHLIRPGDQLLVAWGEPARSALSAALRRLWGHGRGLGFRLRWDAATALGEQTARHPPGGG